MNTQTTTALSVTYERFEEGGQTLLSWRDPGGSYEISLTVHETRGDPEETYRLVDTAGCDEVYTWAPTAVWRYAERLERAVEDLDADDPAYVAFTGEAQRIRDAHFVAGYYLDYEIWF